MQKITQQDTIQQDISQRAIDHYFVIISDHNVAEYRACLKLQPKNIHLITSKKMYNMAEMFRRLYQEKNLEYTKNISIVDGYEELLGDSGKDTQIWLEKFKQYIQLHCNSEQERIVFNITGGTKILSSMLMQAYPWDILNYQAFGKNYIEVLDGKMQYIKNLELSENFNLLDGIRLYTDNIKKHSPNPIENIELAKMRFEAQLNQDNIDNPFVQITGILEKYWNKDFLSAQNKDTFNIAWTEFDSEQPQRIKHFFDTQLLPLIKPHAKLTSNEKTLTLPVKYTNQNLANWQKWISGDWFEQLIKHWLVEKIGHDHTIETGIQIVPQNVDSDIQLETNQRASGNETDILLFKNEKIHFLELKADLPKGEKPQKFINQIIDQTHNLGKVERVLILSPMIKRRVKSEQWLQFLLDSHAKRIQVITPHNADELATALKI